MKILIINISLRPESASRHFPVGIAYIATAIKNAGFEFDILDLDLNGQSDEIIEKKIGCGNYDVFCFGCIVTGYKTVKKLCRIIKKYHPRSTIIIGNSVASSIHEILLNNTEADIAVFGEGDETIVELLNYLNENIKDLSSINGISFRSGEKIFKTISRQPIQNISNLPIINYKIFNTEEYIKYTKFNIPETNKKIKEARMLPINTARGCINKCGFCYHVFRDFAYRYRSPEHICNEIELLISKFNINYVQFWDELTFFSKAQAKKLSSEILNRKININWVGNCRANLFTKDEDIDVIEEMKESGCIGMGYAIESTNKKILEDMNKNISTEQFVKQTGLFQSLGITTWTSLVIGYPKENKETINNTFDFCIKNNIYPSVGFLLPQPGSPIYSYAIDKGYIVDEEKYILGMGDRQDLSINMTEIEDNELKDIVFGCLKKCNAALGIGLKEDSLIKTENYKKQEKAK